jgi:hypothetical protein
MSVLDLVNCFALHMPSESLLYALPDRHGESDFHDFASYMLDSDISASHLGLDRYALLLRSRNGDNEP